MLNNCFTIFCCKNIIRLFFKQNSKFVRCLIRLYRKNANRKVRNRKWFFLRNDKMPQKTIFWKRGFSEFFEYMRCKIPFTEKQKISFASFQIRFLFYSDALKKTWFYLVRWRASLKGKRLRKLINIRDFVIKNKFCFALKLALLRVVTRKFIRSTRGYKSISMCK